MSDRLDPKLARQGRIAALVIAGAALLSIFAPVIVGALGLPARYEILFLLFALAAFIWALVVAIRIWQNSRDT
jgi:MFS family permease